MLSIPNYSGPDGYGETSFSGRDLTDPEGRKVSIQSIINQANTIVFAPILADLGIRIDKYNRSIRCPFHSGGNERSASLYFYSDTNQFHCFGCKKHGNPTDFVALFRHISRLDAALFLIEKHGSLIGSPSTHDLSESKCIHTNESIIEFSNDIRSFIKSHDFSSEAVAFAEKLCFSFDKINEKHSLTNEGLGSLINKLRAKLEQY